MGHHKYIFYSKKNTPLFQFKGWVFNTNNYLQCIKWGKKNNKIYI